MISFTFFCLGLLTLSLNFVRVFGLAISDIFFLLSILVQIVAQILSHKPIISYWIQKNNLIPAFLILLGSLISMINSKSLSTAFIETMQLLFVIIFFSAIIRDFVIKGKGKIIICCFVFSGIITSSIAVFDFLTGSQIGIFLSNTPDFRIWGRFAGTLGHPNKFGYYLVLTSLLTIFLISVEKKKIRKLLIITGFLLQFFGIYLSGSLNAFISFALGLFLIFFNKLLTFKLTRWNVMLSSLGLIILLFSSMYFLLRPNILEDSVLETSLNRVSENTSLSRIDIYKQAIQQIELSPIIGTGFDQVSTSNIDISQRSIDGTIHNNILQIFYVGGIFSLIGLLIIYIKIFLYSLKVFGNKVFFEGNEKQFAVSIAACSFAILFMDQFQDAIYTREKWLIFALLASVFYFYEKNRGKHETNNSMG